MKKRTKEEIETKIYELWDYNPKNKPAENDWREKKYWPSVDIWDDGRVRIRLASMYDPPGFTFRQIMALAEFFETDNIQDVDRSKSNGCETCDYGSVAEFTIEIKPGKWPLKS